MNSSDWKHLTRLDPQLKDRWVAALRSGKYVQIAGTLREGEATEYRMCVMGVLADVAAPDEWKLAGPSHWHWSDKTGYYEAFERHVEGAKLVFNTLTGMNDGYAVSDTDIFEQRRHSFTELADWIEENL